MKKYTKILCVWLIYDTSRTHTHVSYNLYIIFRKYCFIYIYIYNIHMSKRKTHIIYIYNIRIVVKNFYTAFYAII